MATRPLLEDYPRRSVVSAEPYFATTEQYPVAERNVMFARHDGAPGYFTKRQYTPYGSSAASSDLSGSGDHQDTDLPSAPIQDSAGQVRVDAGALQRLLLSVGGALSDLQRRGARYGGDDSSTMTELPPDYEEGSSTHVISQRL